MIDVRRLLAGAGAEGENVFNAPVVKKRGGESHVYVGTRTHRQKRLQPAAASPRPIYIYIYVCTEATSPSILFLQCTPPPPTDAHFAPLHSPAYHLIHVILYDATTRDYTIMLRRWSSAAAGNLRNKIYIVEDVRDFIAQNLNRSAW